MHERLVRVFTDIGAEYEIIFVNDGSPDNAREVLAELASRDPHVVVINHARAFGSQSAFTSGMQIATGDGIVLLDGDLQDPPELIPEFVARWKEGYDVVYGERVKREASFVMRIAYRGFYRVFKRLAYVNVPLDAGDFGLIDRRVVEAMNSLPEKHRFLRGLRAWVGFRQLGVPYVRPERMFGRTTNSLRKNIGWARRAIVSFLVRPSRHDHGPGDDHRCGVRACARGRGDTPPCLPQLGTERIYDRHRRDLVHRRHPTPVSRDIGTYLAHMYEEVKGQTVLYRRVRDQPSAVEAVVPEGTAAGQVRSFPSPSAGRGARLPRDARLGDGHPPEPESQPAAQSVGQTPTARSSTPPA